jgi:hypothetical protein
LSITWDTPWGRTLPIIEGTKQFISTGAILMDDFGPMLAGIETDFAERKVRATIIDSYFHEQLLIFIRKDLLDMFQAQDGVAVAGELLSPGWGKYLDDNMEGVPGWMSDVKYKTVNKGRLTESMEEVDKGFAYLERRIRN